MLRRQFQSNLRDPEILVVFDLEQYQAGAARRTSIFPRRDNSKNYSYHEMEEIEPGAYRSF
jgi:hypothetical protein